MKKLFLALFVAGAFLAQSCGDNEQGAVESANEANEDKRDGDSAMASTSVVEDDSKFMVESASSGLMEVELARIAQQKATNPQVKEFAGTILRDHSNANEELKALASRKNVTLPTAPGEEHQGHIKDINEKTGRDFDKAYMDMMVEHHKDDVDRFEKASNDARDAELKAFAGKTLPVLRSHLEQARSLNDAIKK